MPTLLVGNRSAERKCYEKNVTVDFSVSSMPGRYLKIKIFIKLYKKFIRSQGLVKYGYNYSPQGADIYLLGLDELL